MAAVKKVSAFTTIKHITSQQALPSIFDDALYGRRTLRNFYLYFKPSTLQIPDILNGDANVICMGPQNIDPIANGGIIITFDLPKLIKNKPSAFYKQRDLEYELNKIRQLQLGKKTIFFSHTTSYLSALKPYDEETYLMIADPQGRLEKISRAPKSSFIAYNLEQMHEILTLNFFRFMDNLTDMHGTPARAYIDNFYQEISELNENDLEQFLNNIEKNMTDTAEFNFYGAHRIDFSTIVSISARYENYTLYLTEFLAALKRGEINELRKARAFIPELFQSYRFLDYLLSNVKHKEVGYYLDNLRKQCKTPEWIQYTPLLAPEHFNICWEICPELAKATEHHETKEEKINIMVDSNENTGKDEYQDPFGKDARNCNFFWIRNFKKLDVVVNNLVDRIQNDTYLNTASHNPNRIGFFAPIQSTIKIVQQINGTTKDHYR